MNSPAVLLLTALAAAVAALTYYGLTRRVLVRDEEPLDAVTVTLTADTAALEAAFLRLSTNVSEAFTQIGRALMPGLQGVADVLTGLGRALSPLTRANDVVHVAGLEGRYYVRAGLSPRYSSPARRDALVAAVLAGTAEGCLFLTPDNRGRVAAAVINGWVTSYDGDAPAVLAWHRALGDVRVEVGRAR